MKLIGKGLFTKAYLKDENTVELHSIDKVKECMAMGFFPEHKLFPTIKQADNRDDMGEVKVYEEKFYPKVSSIKNNVSARDWKLYQLLRKLFISGWGNESYSLWVEAFKTLPEEYKDERDALLEACDALANYGDDCYFEISPRNVATDNNSLILLDCFFMRSQCIEEKSKKSRSY